jgi:hypothetical protein
VAWEDLASIKTATARLERIEGQLAKAIRLNRIIELVGSVR